MSLTVRKRKVVAASDMLFESYVPLRKESPTFLPHLGLTGNITTPLNMNATVDAA